MIELVKNILLVALSCLAIYLTVLANDHYDLKLPFFGDDSQQTWEATETDTVLEASKPVKMAVTNSYGRYALLYTGEAVEQMYDRLGKYLGEALGTMASVEAVDEKQVMESLEQPGIYYEFPGRVRLSALAAWLGAGLPGEADDPEAELYIISIGEKEQTLCYRTVSGWYRCRIELREDVIEEIDIYRPNNVSFAFELAQSEASFGNIEDFCLVDSQPAPVAVTAQAMTGQLREKVASYLGFNPYSDSSYIEDNGDEVFTANSSMLRLETGGLLTFNSPGGESRDMTAAERIELARAALSELTFPGEAKMYFTGEENADGVYTLSFDYFVSGIRVITPTGHGAQVVMEGGEITRIVLWLRSYYQTDGVESILPAVQAAAMRSGRLELVYTDNGSDTLSAGWRAD